MRTRLLTLTALVAVLTITATAPLPAQAGPRVGHAQVGLRPPASREMIGREPPDLRVPRQTHWVKGGIIGGAILGLGSFLLVAALADYQEGDEGLGYYLEPTLFSAGMGFVIGALIGGQFEKN